MLTELNMREEFNMEGVNVRGDRKSRRGDMIIRVKNRKDIEKIKERQQ